MKKIISVYKPISKTPLEMIQEIKVQFPEYKYLKMGYAGRLDPLAEGILVVLVGEECKNRKSYERLPKEYEFEVLWGVSTDSYDLMGMIQSIQVPIFDLSEKLTTSLSKIIEQFQGEFEQPYPPYSSVKVKGRSLFHWARENKLSEIIIPVKKIEVYSENRTISGEELLSHVVKHVSNVHGVFRQKEIIVDWQKRLSPYITERFFVSKFHIICSSGTYVRSIASEMGKKLSVPSLAFSIKRTKVGQFDLRSTYEASP